MARVRWSRDASIVAESSGTTRRLREVFVSARRALRPTLCSSAAVTKTVAAVRSMSGQRSAGSRDLVQVRGQPFHIVRGASHEFGLVPVARTTS